MSPHPPTASDTGESARYFIDFAAVDDNLAAFAAAMPTVRTATKALEEFGRQLARVEAEVAAAVVTTKCTEYHTRAADGRARQMRSRYRERRS